MKGCREEIKLLSLFLLFLMHYLYYPMQITHSDLLTVLSALLSFRVDIWTMNKTKNNSGFNPIFSTFWKIIAETNFTQIKRPDMWRSGCHRTGYDRLYCFVIQTLWNFTDFKETTVGKPSSFKASWHTVVTFSIKPFLVHPYSVYVTRKH